LKRLPLIQPLKNKTCGDEDFMASARSLLLIKILVQMNKK